MKESRKYLHARAGVRVHFVAPTDTKPARYVVQIRDYPNKTFSVHKAPDDMHHEDQPQFFAEMRLKELGLSWRLTGLTFIERTGFIFTTNTH